MSDLTAAQQSQLREIENNFSTALAMHEAGRLAEAKPLYELVLRALPRHAETLHLYGTLLHQQGSNDRAVPLLCEAIELKPTAATYHNHLGAALRADGRLDDALSAFRQAVALNAEYPEAFLNIAVVLVELGRQDEAVASGVTAGTAGADRGRCEAPPRCVAEVRRPRRGGLGGVIRRSALERARGGDLSASSRRASGSKKTARNGSSRPARVSLFRRRPMKFTRISLERCLATGTLSILSPWARRATCLKPSDSRLWSNLAAENYRVNQFFGTVDSAKRAIVIDPGEKSAYNNLGTGLFNVGDFEQAIRFARSGLVAFPDLAELGFILCQSAFCLGDHETGWRYWPSRFRMEEAPARIGLPSRNWNGGAAPDGNFWSVPNRGSETNSFSSVACPTFLKMSRRSPWNATRAGRR